jgi:molybdopterin molybdotransferase
MEVGMANPTNMLSVDQALEKVLAAFQQLPSEIIPFTDALGRTLAQDIQATENLPPFANSSMDGYAVRVADVAEASRAKPVTLAVIADIAAGAVPKVQIGPGQAARIMTGAPLPPGANTVVPVEQTDTPPQGTVGAPRTAPSKVTIYAPGKLGEYIRPVGEDIQKGQVVLHSGRVLRATDLGVLAGLGILKVKVIRRPVVAILSTGDELLGADQPLAPGKIRDANGYAIAALAMLLGARVLRLGIARDTADDVRARFQRAVDVHADLIISTAGVSVGAYDVVKTVVESLGALDFWQVNMRPGKPLAFGNIDSIPFVGLPGNPVSAVVTFDVFVRPAIEKMAGRPWEAALSEAEVGEPLRSDGRRTYTRVTLRRVEGRLIAYSTGNQSSGVLTSLVYADGLLIIPEGMTDIPAGTRLPVRLFSEVF